MDTMIIELDVCCEVIRKEDNIDLVFEDGTKWSDLEFKKFGVEIYCASSKGQWPEVCFKGTEEQLRSYLEYHEWDDIDFIIEDCRID